MSHITHNVLLNSRIWKHKKFNINTYIKLSIFVRKYFINNKQTTFSPLPTLNKFFLNQILLYYYGLKLCQYSSKSNIILKCVRFISSFVINSNSIFLNFFKNIINHSNLNLNFTKTLLLSYKRNKFFPSLINTTLNHTYVTLSLGIFFTFFFKT
jgi:hypothetical protein